MVSLNVFQQKQVCYSEIGWLSVTIYCEDIGKIKLGFFSEILSGRQE